MATNGEDPRLSESQPIPRWFRSARNLFAPWYRWGKSAPGVLTVVPGSIAAASAFVLDASSREYVVVAALVIAASAALPCYAQDLFELLRPGPRSHGRRLFSARRVRGAAGSALATTACVALVMWPNLGMFLVGFYVIVWGVAHEEARKHDPSVEPENRWEPDRSLPGRAYGALAGVTTYLFSTVSAMIRRPGVGPAIAAMGVLAVLVMMFGIMRETADPIKVATTSSSTSNGAQPTTTTGAPEATRTTEPGAGNGSGTTGDATSTTSSTTSTTLSQGDDGDGADDCEVSPVPLMRKLADPRVERLIPSFVEAASGLGCTSDVSVNPNGLLVATHLRNEGARTITALTVGPLDGSVPPTVLDDGQAIAFTKRFDAVTSVSEQNYTDQGTYLWLWLADRCVMVVRPGGNTNVEAFEPAATNVLVRGARQLDSVVNGLYSEGAGKWAVTFIEADSNVHTDAILTATEEGASLTLANGIQTISATSTSVCSSEDVAAYDGAAQRLFDRKHPE